MLVGVLPLETDMRDGTGAERRCLAKTMSPAR
jgi:hypothetical protein